MRLKNENFRNMKINLRSGATVDADNEGCIEVDHEGDANFMLAHGGYQAVTARSPRALPGLGSKSGGDGKLWSGGPTRAQVEDLADHATDLESQLREAKDSIAALEIEREALGAQLRDALKALATAAQKPGAGSAGLADAEGGSEAQKDSSAPRKPKAPKPEADKS